MDTDTDTDTDDALDSGEAPGTDDSPVPGTMDPPVVDWGPTPATLVRCTLLQTLSLYVDPDEAKADDLGYTLAVGAAALRTCWPENVAWPTRKRPRPWKLGVPAAEYGRPIFEALAAELDIPMGELSRTLTRARRWAASCTVRAVDAKRARDFSRAPEAEATPGA